MNPTNEEFRELAQAFRDDFPHEEKTDACPDPDIIWNAVAGQASPEETLKWVNHTATCPHCAEHWRMARALQQSESFTEQLGKPLQRKRKPLITLLPLAAVAVIALGLALTLRVPELDKTDHADPTLRSAPVPTIASAIAKDKPLDRENCLLSWRLSVTDKDVVYRLQVTTADPFDVVTDIKQAASQYQIPAADLQRLPPETPLLWRVSATLNDQSEVHSPTFTHLLQ